MSTLSGITIVRDADANPVFTWSVGYDYPVTTTGQYSYMATVRANPNGSRIPTQNVVYRESGITTTNWQFTLAKNIGSSGGPYRDYQVVVEGYDVLGKTSAGNQIGSVEEKQWNTYSLGYDLVEISNPRQTGIELGYNFETRKSVGGSYFDVTGGYRSLQYIGPNGDVGIEYISGVFNADIVGGYLYISSGTFPKNETAAMSGEWATAVKRSRFDFNPLLPKIIHPTAASHIRGAPYAYGSISFYDDIDRVMIDSGVHISSGLYMSNNALFEANSAVSKISLGAAELFTVRIPGAAWLITDPEVTSALPPNGQVIAISQDPAGPGATSIFYMGPPLTGSPYTGIYGGGAGGGGCPCP